MVADQSRPDGEDETGAAAEPVPDSEPRALDEETSDPDAEDDFGPPFVSKTFGGAFVWAKGAGYVATVLRVKEGKTVPVSTQNRRDMTIMLTGGRAVLEVDARDDVDRVELVPAGPVNIDPGHTYRLVALTEVELFTVYTPVN